MNRILPTAAAIALSLALCGCATPSEREFGSSARHMVKGQIYDPAAPREVTGALDGHKAAQAVERYRADSKAQSKSQTSVLIPATTQ